jgi:hypothetical protein
MQTNMLLLSLALSFLPGCAGAPARPAPASHERAVEALVGVWAGKAIGTPMGELPLAIAFDREAGGDVHGRVDDGRGRYLDFRFHRDGARWLLLEEGQLPGVGRQALTMVPVPAAAARWVDDGAGAFAVELTVEAEAMVMTTTRRGERHAEFRLQRARGETADRIRHAIARGPRPAAE